MDPYPGDPGYTQWKDAMKMVARLPEGVPQEFRKKVRGKYNVNDKCFLLFIALCACTYVTKISRADRMGKGEFCKNEQPNIR